MKTPNERLQDARKAAGFETATDAARKHRWNENTYRSHENGERGLKAKTALRYAEAFNVNHAWLLTGYGEHSVQNQALVYGWVKRQGVIFRDQKSPPLYRVSLPFVPPSYTRIYEIDSDHLQPRYRRRDLLLTGKLDPRIAIARINPGRDNLASMDAAHDFEVIAWSEGKGYLLSAFTSGRVINGIPDTAFRNISTGRPMFFKDGKQIESVDTVMMVIYAGSYFSGADHISRQALLEGADEQEDEEL